MLTLLCLAKDFIAPWSTSSSYTYHMHPSLSFLAEQIRVGDRVKTTERPNRPQKCKPTISVKTITDNCRRIIVRGICISMVELVRNRTLKVFSNLSGELVRTPPIHDTSCLNKCHRVHTFLPFGLANLLGRLICFIFVNLPSIEAISCTFFV